MENIHAKTGYFGRDLEAMTFAENYHKWILEEFKPYLGKYAAEVGAGTGNFTELFLEHVDHLVAFEPSKNMYPLLKDRFIENPKIKISNSIFNDNFYQTEKFFDSVVYVNVLEHVENDEKELLNVHKSLAHGGHALIFIPAFSFLYSDFDKKLGHFRRYCKNDFFKLARKTGFKIKKVKYIDFVGIMPWYIFFVILKHQLTSRKVILYDKFIVPIMQKIERLIIPPVGKNLLVVMKKN